MDFALAARRAVKTAVRLGSSAAIRAAGVDATETLPGRATLIVAPHPDDETLGCAATIARMRSLGTDVHVAFVTGGGDSPAPAPMSVAELVTLRRAEARRALAALRVPVSAVAFWDYPDGGVTAHVERVAHDIADFLSRCGAEQVLVTSQYDRHPDHVAASAAAHLAVNRVNPPPTIYEFPIWQRVPAWTVARQIARADHGTRAAGRPQLVRSARFADVKAAALESYASQLPHFPPGFTQDFRHPYETFWLARAAAPPT